MTTTQLRCPGCSSDLTIDPHWPAWCAGCEWGVDPEPERTSYQGRLARRWQERLNRLSAREHAQLLEHGLDRPRSNDRWLVLLLASTVHLVTMLLVVAAVLVLRTHIWAGARYGIPILLLLIVSQVRPRFPRYHPGGTVLTAQDAPALHGLVSRLAQTLEVVAPEQIVINGAANAAWGINGVKRTRILTLGLPLWAVLDGQAKIALLGHELGHEANGDLRSGWWVGSALWSLHTWRYLLTPVKTGRNRAALMQYRTGGMGLSLAAEWLMGILMAPVLLVLGVVRIALSDLADRSGQRAEHIADRLGAQLGGTAGALALESSLIAPDLLEFSLDVAVRRDPDADLWQTARSFQASVPESERDRRFRLARRTLQRSDATHPPTLRRIELLQAGPPLAASVLLSPEEERAVDAEVRKGERWVRARIVDRQKR